MMIAALETILFVYSSAIFRSSMMAAGSTRLISTEILSVPCPRETVFLANKPIFRLGKVFSMVAGFFAFFACIFCREQSF